MATAVENGSSSWATADDVVIVYRKRRWVELALIVVGQSFGFAGYLLTSINLSGALPASWQWTAAAWFSVGIASHLVVRILLPYADPILLPLTLTLTGIGLAMIYRIDQIPTVPRTDARTQFQWVVLGVVSLAVVALVVRDHKVLQRFPYLMFLAGIALLLMPMVPGLGREINGSNIWIGIGRYSFQPAELAKIVLTIAFAAYLTEKRDVLALAGRRILMVDLPRARDLGPIVIMWAASMLVLVGQRDLGTSLLFFGLFVVMLYVATIRPGWVVLGGLMFLAGAYASYLEFGHVRVRVNAWLDPFSNPDANGQVISAQYGLAWGGLTGRGWGLGRPGLTPLAKSDFIAGAIGEELGIVGLMALIVVYGIIVARGLRTALAARDPFGKLLATGLAFVFALQVFAIIGGVTRLLPLTGLTTPFMSQGGSSMVANWVVVALMLVVSHQSRRPATAAPATTPAGVSMLDSETTSIISVPAARALPRPEPLGGRAAGLARWSRKPVSADPDAEPATQPDDEDGEA